MPHTRFNGEPRATRIPPTGMLVRAHHGRLMPPQQHDVSFFLLPSLPPPPSTSLAPPLVPFHLYLEGPRPPCACHPGVLALPRPHSPRPLLTSFARPLTCAFAFARGPAHLCLPRTDDFTSLACALVYARPSTFALRICVVTHPCAVIYARSLVPSASVFAPLHAILL
ncbi:hypothetical protein EVG20_g9971 [Dentipellis fragilis]|uniref:Uncharacterized protein n=1 Tax=Dentipellis fragilis TaxID=205917 RepID=A0A4Y9XVI5_9AGAM|nr:hypothetical protein EVG20_g9971 [Dentipellis fragilis]